MKQIFLLFSHNLTQEQREELLDLAGSPVAWMPLPGDLQESFSQFPPGSAFPQEIATALSSWLEERLQPQDLVVIQGEPGLTLLLVHVAHRLGALPLYATTRRQASEIRLQDGSISLQHRFQHAGFRAYPRA